jgi:transcriptional regulator with XRE-family HTH domain
MPLTPDEIGARIREARLARGWTHEDLAREMGVNWRTVHRWQAGQLPRVATLTRLAAVLDLPESYFVDSAAGATSLADLRERLDDLSTRVDALTRALERIVGEPTER